jgi:hypothetical protein
MTSKHAEGTERSNKKGLPTDIMGKKLKNGEVAVSFRRKLMALKLEHKRYACFHAEQPT